MDVHKKGRIGYKEFLTMLVPHGDNKPSMFHDSFKSYMRKGSFYSLVPQGVAPIRLGSQGKFTPVGKLNLSDIQQVIKKKIGNQINSFLALLKQRDPDGTGFLSKSLLLQVLRKLDVFITFPQLEEVMPFIQHVLLFVVSRASANHGSAAERAVVCVADRCRLYFLQSENIEIAGTRSGGGWLVW